MSDETGRMSWSATLESPDPLCRHELGCIHCRAHLRSSDPIAAALPAPDPAPTWDEFRIAIIKAHVDGTTQACLDALDYYRAALAARPAPYDDDEFLDDGRLVIPSPEFVQRDPMRRPTARPGPPASVPDEDLPGYRQPFTGPLGSRGDPTVALAGPSEDADAAWEALWADLVRFYGVEPHYRPLIEAALRAVAPSDGAGGLDVERLARAMFADDKEPELWTILGERTREQYRKNAAKVAARYASFGPTS